MIYLDNGATTFPKPASVTNAVQRALREYGANPGRSGHKMSMRAANEVFECRKTAAEFFNTPNIENVVFTLNCTEACNIVLKGLLKKNDHVVVSCLEHNAVMRPLHELSKNGNISYTVAKFDPYDNDSVVDSFRRSINSNTKLIICVHASNVWGIRLPVERLAALAHIYGIQIMVDCAQTAGVLPIDLSDSKIDYLCIAGHKGLYGPMGTGMLIMSTPERLSPFVLGGTGSLSLSLEQPENTPDKFESGTPNFPGIVGLKAGINFVKKRRPAEILAHETRLLKRLYDKLANINGVKLYTPRPDGNKILPVISFNVHDVYGEETAEYLNKHGIYTRGGLHCAPAAHEFMGTDNQGTVRITPSVFTTREEIDFTASVIKKFAFGSKKTK